jgi:hypothetical protein
VNAPVRFRCCPVKNKVIRQRETNATSADFYVLLCKLAHNFLGLHNA